MNKQNFILMADSYKYSHHLQIPKGTEYTTSYIEARGADDKDYTKTVFFGLQMFIKKYMLNPITKSDVLEAKEVIEMHGEPFNYDDWMIIVNEFNGYLPLEIESVPEGTVMPLRNVMVQVRNTDPRFAWLTSFVETALIRAIWYPTTVATNSWAIKQFMKETHERTGSVQGVDFKLHDFGARGVSSEESSAIGGIAHLVNFMGTDTVASLMQGRKYYNIDMAGFSIPAAEHSTITSWGKENEVEAYRNMLKQFAKPGAMVAVVSDTYDMYHAADHIWGDVLREEVLDSGATVVIRPDSGDPVRVPLDVIEILMNKYGYTVNNKGFRTLPDCVRVIQGDGINKDSIKQILAGLEEHKLTLDNLAFGMGGALLQQINRDTLKFAMKANSNTINGIKQEIYKSPKTDGGKASKAGEQALIKQDGAYITMRRDDIGDAKNELKVVYKNGKLLVDDTFEEIRKRSNV